VAQQFEVLAWATLSQFVRERSFDQDSGSTLEDELFLLLVGLVGRDGGTWNAVASLLLEES
jgi:hypothetical protein